MIINIITVVKLFTLRIAGTNVLIFTIARYFSIYCCPVECKRSEARQREGKSLPRGDKEDSRTSVAFVFINR